MNLNQLKAKFPDGSVFYTEEYARSEMYCKHPALQLTFIEIQGTWKRSAMQHPFSTSLESLNSKLSVHTPFLKIRPFYDCINQFELDMLP